MTSKSIRTRWGILGPGTIAQQFCKDLLLDPLSRGVKDIKHEIVAIGSSTSANKAKNFADAVGIEGARYYGSYEDFLKDETVDIVYIASPHSHHYRHTKQCLEAGKNVLCEKPFTMNAAQAQALADLARQKKLFLMEATWIRFFPLTEKLRELVQGGEIGHVQRIFADHGRELVDETTSNTSRFVDLHQGAGGFLDLGLYSLTWCFLPLYNWKKASERVPPSVSGSMVLHKYGFDEHSTGVLTWPDAVAVATSSMTSPSDRTEDGAVGPATKMIGSTGTITITSPSYRPTEFTVHHDDIVTKYRFPIPGHGMFWEADSVARCLAEGKIENELMPLLETVEILTVMDKLRQIGGLKYPEHCEAVD